MYLLCNNKTQRPRLEKTKALTILRLKNYSFFPKKLNSLLNVPIPVNPIWAWGIIRAILRYRINILHVHDLPLALLVLIIGKVLHRHVVFDIHENYPAALRVWGKKGLLPGLFRNPEIAARIEKICLKYSSSIIVVIDEHKWYLDKKGLQYNRLSIVGNTVDHDTYDKIDVNREIVHKYKKSYVLMYVGYLSPERDLETAIRSLSFLATKIPNTRLVLVGDGIAKDQLIHVAEKENVLPMIEFTGWVDFTQTPSYITSSKICIIPQPSNDLIDNGVPHKLFQYMLLEKPIVVSDAKALARVVTETKCGEIFKSGSPQSFANAVLRIHSSHKKYGQNGKQAVLKKYNWHESSKELINMYDELTSTH